MELQDNLVRVQLSRIAQLSTLWRESGQETETKRVDRTFAPLQGTRRLRIAYMMNHVRVCGGVKILFEHANRLVARGHEVTILCRQPKPTWMEIQADYLEVPRQAAYGQMMPDVDVIVCTVVDQVPECFFHKQAPVILFEQGDTYIYEFDKLDASTQDYYQKLWSLPVPIVGVSSVLVNTLHSVFGRKGQILHNALNDKVFFPRVENVPTDRKPRILFLGQEENHFKGISLIRQALQQVRQTGRDFDEVWVAQNPQKSLFDGEMIINPSQERLGEVYRSCDIFVSGSYYESFPLPPLEAMTSGCTVVSTDNEGIKEYALDGENCLLGKVGDANSLAVHILDLLDHPEKRNRLVESGYRTASRFHWDLIMANWEEYLYGVIEQWEPYEGGVSLTLRTETLPRGLSVEKARARMESVQSTMSEDWCLWLIEGETLDSEATDVIKRTLQIGVEVEVAFALQVGYDHDVPEHPILRTEQRLLKRGHSLTHGPLEAVVLPIQIKGGSQPYFLRPWLATLREKYLNQQFADMVPYVQQTFSTLSPREQLIASKWLVLALLELDQLTSAINIVRDGLERDSTYSDLLYLYARMAMILERPDLSNPALEMAKTIGTAWHYEEAFAGMKELCEMYL